MLALRKRSLQKELLDEINIPFDDIQRNLIELNIINTYLGGHKINVDGIKPFLQNQIDTLHIVEIGCGGGDNLAVIEKFLKAKRIQFKLSGIDLKKECVDYANQHYPSIEFICADYKDVLFQIKPDIIFNSLFCHHFTEEEIIHILRWMKKNARQGFFVNDLQRHPVAYYAIKFLTLLFSKSDLVKNDAPLSVARSLHKKEWTQLLKQAEINDCLIEWKWAFRFLIKCNIKEK
jgi:2-polyprenyl-3-methyl-5-hydroxy-6-metoxy-1,4-benzoquinol methylase